MKLKEIMSLANVHINPTDSLLSVVKLLAEKHHSCGLICEDEKLVGIVTERDIVRLIARMAGGELDGETKIQELMTPQPICIDGETELVEALELAKSRNIRHLPIIDATQKLEGIVTLTDMIKA